MKAEIYTKSACPFCVKAKALLKLKNIEFTEMSLDSGEFTKSSIEKRLGAPVRTVPQIWLDNEYVGGFTELNLKLQGN